MGDREEERRLKREVNIHGLLCGDHQHRADDDDDGAENIAGRQLLQAAKEQNAPENRQQWIARDQRLDPNDLAEIERGEKRKNRAHIDQGRGEQPCGAAPLEFERALPAAKADDEQKKQKSRADGHRRGEKRVGHLDQGRACGAGWRCRRRPPRGAGKRCPFCASP